jgi:hypothetical protein
VFQLTYISTQTPGFGSEEIGNILKFSRESNRRCDITGFLLYDGKRFLQTLEGEQGAVETLYNRIEADDRHRAAVLLSAKSIDERCFANWAMAYRAVAAADQSALMQEVDTLVASVSDPSLRALFMSFARLERTAV